MAIKITVDGKTYNNIDAITVGGKVLTLAYVEDSTGGDTGGDTGGTTAQNYTIKYNLTNCTSSNAVGVIKENTEYSTVITANSGYELESVTVTMGGTPVAVTNGVIDVPDVTGNIIITAMAVQTSSGDSGSEVVGNGWIDGQPYELNKTDCLSLDTTTGETVTANSGTMVTDYLPCLGASAFTYEAYDGASILNYALYDENKQFINSSGLGQPNDPSADGTITLKNFYAIPKSNGVAYVRFTQRSSIKYITSVTPHKYPALSESTEYEVGRWYETDAVSGGVNAGTGVLTEDASWYRTGYLLVYGASKISFAYYTRKTVVFYDSNKNYISGETVNNTFDFAIPENAVYVVASSIDMRDQMIWIAQ